MNDSLADQLRKLVGMQPGAAAPNDSRNLQGRAYQLHTQEAKAMGQQALTPQAWATQQGK